ncbi:hypothetical protein [Haladaptatus cibarius]|uniref:hypothetical protein n=1 Tax=Haladaptatus cibarius TaxID=453847 RepID=UPI000679B50D|nr:hypothetical protein [Haladaptatus cibarius]
MDIRPIARGLAFYTVLAGAITVGGVYFLTYSGLYTLVVTGVGLLFIVLGGAASGPVGASAVETGDAEISGMMVEDTQLLPSPGEFGARAILLFYGAGLVLWSVIVLTFFQSGLQ